MSYLLTDILNRTQSCFPRREAVRFRRQSLTYGELSARSNQLAHALIDLGVKPSDRVGIYLSKSLESAVAMHGVWAAGAAYVPLDPWAPNSQLRYVLDDCGIRHLITDHSKLRRVQEFAKDTRHLTSAIGLPEGGDVPLRCLEWKNVYARTDSAPPTVSRGEHDLAYILYTSGSTGQPKGIMHSHRSALSFINWAADAYQLVPQDRVSNHAPLHFDLSLFDFMATAKAGATTCIVPEEFMKLPASLSQWIADEQISVWYSVPVALTQLLLRGLLDQRDLSALRWVLFGGEPFARKHLLELMELIPTATFSHVYGVTELNVSHYYHVPRPLEAVEESIPIGNLCDHLEACVVGDDDQPVPAGEIGELLLRGPAMMQGYCGRPDLDQAAFYRHRAEPGLENRFYRTGDLVQMSSDGSYRFMGRKDRQVKARGHRVELDEIEATLTSYKEVEEAAVFPAPDSDGSTRIVAVVKLYRESQSSEIQLTAYLRQRLPRYALPSLVMVDQIPRTSAGKIDRQLLAAKVKQPAL